MPYIKLFPSIQVGVWLPISYEGKTISLLERIRPSEAAILLYLYLKGESSGYSISKDLELSDTAVYKALKRLSKYNIFHISRIKSDKPLEKIIYKLNLRGEYYTVLQVSPRGSVKIADLLKRFEPLRFLLVERAREKKWKNISDDELWVVLISLSSSSFPIISKILPKLKKYWEEFYDVLIIGGYIEKEVYEALKFSRKIDNVNIFSDLLWDILFYHLISHESVGGMLKRINFHVDLSGFDDTEERELAEMASLLHDILSKSLTRVCEELSKKMEISLEWLNILDNTEARRIKNTMCRTTLI